MFRVGSYFFISLFFLFLKEPIAYAQDQNKADSLVRIYESGQYIDELELLDEITKIQANPDDVIFYSNILIEKASEDSIGNYLINGFLQKGNGFKLKGDYSEALDSYFQSIKLAQRFGQEERIGAIYISVGDTYSTMKDYDTADNYYEKGILAIRNSNDSIRLATALLNSGERYFYANNLQKALQNSEEAKEIFMVKNHEVGLGYAFGNLGMVYSKQNNDVLAKDLLNQAIEILEKNDDLYPVCVYNLYLAYIAQKENDLENAFNYARSSLSLATNYGLKKEKVDANLLLFELHNESGNRDSALFYHLNYIAIRDSVRNLEEIENIAKKTRQFEVSQKQAEVDLLNEKNQSQKILIFSSALAMILIGNSEVKPARRRSTATDDEQSRVKQN